MNDLINDKGVFRTAPAKLCLLKKGETYLLVLAHL